MLDTLLVEEIIPSPDGVLLRVGPAIFVAEAAERDIDNLTSHVFCQLEAGDEMVLVAFSSVERRDLYRRLRKISGIGRRSALAVLDCGEVRDIVRAASAKEHTFWRGVPGLGAKRIAALETALAKYGDRPRPVPCSVSAWVEARDSLVQGGLSLDDAEGKLWGVSDDTNQTAEMLLSALNQS
jgi:hypothetical protein